MTAKAGNSAVEFALIMPFLIGLLVPGIDYGLYIYDNMQLRLAAQAGMDYAARNGYDTAGIASAAANAAPSLHLSANGNCNPTTENCVEVSQFCGCPDSNNNIVQQSCPPIASSTATRPQCTNNAAQTAGVYVNVTTTYRYNTLINYPGTGIPSSQTLSSGQNAVFRLF